MKIAIYYAITLVMNLVCAIAFREHISITTVSLLPIFLIFLSALQAGYFKNNRSKTDFNSANNADLTEEEWEILSVYMSYSYLFSIPLFIPFILFFSMIIKILSLFVFFAAFTSAPIYFRLKHGKEYKTRFKRESDELKEQLKKEELGNIK